MENMKKKNQVIIRAISARLLFAIHFDIESTAERRWIGERYVHHEPRNSDLHLIQTRSIHEAQSILANHISFNWNLFIMYSIEWIEYGRDIKGRNSNKSGNSILPH